MTRATLFILLGVLACNAPKERPNREVQIVQDSVQAQPTESFDLKVRKYEDPKRQTWQDPKLVIEALGDLNDKIIADIGSGTGYFTFQMAVPAQKVIAIDIEQRFLNYIEDRKTEMYDRALAKKIETRLTTAEDASLNENEVDVVLMVNTIGYINNRANYLRAIITGLRDNGRIVIVDYKLGTMPVGPEENLKVSVAEVVRALREAGFQIDKQDSKSLQYQYLIKASKP